MLIPIDHVPEVWGMVEGSIRAAAERAREDPPDYFRDRLFSGEWQLWIVWDGDFRAVVLTRIGRSMDGLQLMFELIAGDGMGEWIHLISKIEAWAREQGCIAVQIDGRKGFERLLDGYRPIRVTLRKTL